MFMKKGRMARRVLAVATTIVLIVSSLSSALSVSAEELLAPEVESGEYYAEGSNSLGRLLTEALEEQPTTDGENGVSSIIMEGDTAQVDFHIAVDGVLLVALYDESTRQLLKSGKIQVSPEDQTAQVPLTGISQPYYIVKAFLLDETLAPVCDAYESMEYTAAYADFMSLTTDDFQPDRVINLDEDKANNFLVLGEDVKTADADMGKNVLVSADEAAGVYTFANIGQDIASLQAGDLFYYNTPGAPENLVVIKVKTVEFSGTDAILTADETSIPELFDYVKIDVDNGTEEFTMAEGSVDPSVTYLGNAEGAPQQASAASARIGGESGVEGSHKFKIKYPSDSKDEDETVSCSLEASLGLRFEGKCKVLYDFRLLSDDYFEASITFDMSADLEASVEGKIDLSIKLGEFGVSPVPGLYVGVRPKLEAEATVSIQAEASLKSVVGGGFDSVNGFVNKSKSPVFTASMEAEGKLFFGINLSPYLTLLQESVADLSLSGRVGVHITAKLEKSTDQDEKVRHSCTNCIDGELYGEASIEATAVLGKDTWLEHEWKRKLFKITTDKSYFYFSLDTMTFGWGPCPNKKFQVACKVTDEDGQPLRGIELDGMLTDENGRCEDYYAAGIYNFELFTPEYEFVRPTDGAFELEEPISLIIVLRYIGDDEPDIEEGEEGPIVAQGNCGPDATWVLYENGDLVISGSGSISFELEDRELIQERAIRADVQEGITEIGYANFIGCAQLQSVNLPQSLQHISGAVFGGCTSLKEIIIPDGVTEIEAATFLECEQLESVKLSDSLTSIGSQAFDGCVQLKEIVLPENVTEIKNRAFYKCEQLESINLPDGLTNVADSSFSCCTSLKEILIPEGVTTIETRAFENCTQLQTVQLPSSLTALGGASFKNTALAEVIIPEGVTKIGGGCFANTDLTEVEIPEGITELNAFYDCTKLRKVSLPESLISIGGFNGCVSLTEITLPDKLTTIESRAFTRTALTKIVIPEGVTDIGWETFEGCTQLASVSLPNSLRGTFWMDCFTDCVSLKEIRIPEGITQLQVSFFSGCRQLEWMYLPSSLIDINDRIIGCPYLTICAPVGSFAQQYAAEHGIPFVADIPTARAACMSALAVEQQEPISAGQSYTVENTVAGGRYLMLVVRDPDAEDLLAADNLLYVDQRTAQGDTLTFTYCLPNNVDGKILITMSSTWKPGDMDGDRMVTITDVMLACKVIARNSAGVVPTDEERRRGDLDGDGKVTIVDVMEICKILARGT